MKLTERLHGVGNMGMERTLSEDTICLKIGGFSNSEQCSGDMSHSAGLRHVTSQSLKGRGIYNDLQTEMINIRACLWREG